MPEISLLMATHNPNPNHLTICLESIRAQTFTDYELVVVDDASDDMNIKGMLDESGIPYTLVRNDYNLGAAKARNRGLEVCRGRYVAIIDDDDVMMPDRLKKQYALAEETGEIIFSNAELIDKDGVVVGHSEYIEDVYGFLLKSGNCLYHSSLMAPAELIRHTRYDERFTFAQDYVLYMRWLDSYKIHVIKEELIQYRLGSNTSSMMKRALSLASCYAAFVEYMSRKRGLKNKLIFIRRSLSVMKQMFVYAFKG